MPRMNKIGTTATSVVRRDGVMIVTYHNTEVVRATDDFVTLNSGGWRTVTTKARMNQAANQYGLGFQVLSRQGQWAVVLDSGAMLTFRDGITFNEEGEIKA